MCLHANGSFLELHCFLVATGTLVTSSTTTYQSSLHLRNSTNGITLSFLMPATMLPRISWRCLGYRRNQLSGKPQMSAFAQTVFSCHHWATGFPTYQFLIRCG